MDKRGGDFGRTLLPSACRAKNFSSGKVGLQDRALYCQQPCIQFYIVGLLCRIFLTAIFKEERERAKSSEIPSGILAEREAGRDSHQLLQLIIFLECKH